MQTSRLLVEKRGRVAWLTLDRPASLNALTFSLVESLTEAVEEAGSDSELRVIVLTGNGGNFCSGLDLKAAVPETIDEFEARDTLAAFQAVIQAIVETPKPVIAGLRGAAVGFGADLALACDFRIFGSSAYVQEKFVDIGLMPDGGGTYWLPQLVGLGRALELLMLGTRVDAAAARSLGLATRVVDDTQVDTTCQELAEQLCAKAPLALAEIKAATRQAAGALGAALERERYGQSRLLTSNDFKEGVRAWRERRRPVFSGPTRRKPD